MQGAVMPLAMGTPAKSVYFPRNMTLTIQHTQRNTDSLADSSQDWATSDSSQSGVTSLSRASL